MTKKNKAYFGYLKKEALSSLSNEEKMALFISEKLFTTTKILSLTSKTAINLLDPEQYKTVKKPVKALLNAYYSHITNTFQEYIENIFIDFFHSFNNQIFALENPEVKKIARLHYLTIIDNIHSPNFDIVRMSENNNGFPKVNNATKLELYSIKQDTFKTRAVQEYSKGLDQFLMGNSKKFNDGLLSEIPILKEIIQFEGDLKILLALNEEFKFEEFDFNYAPKIKSNGSIKTNTLPLSQIPETSLPMPTQEEMNQYVLDYVFSKKD
ncbi:hypothetical protein [Maribacter sp. ACAM166]|uniref:hypothetical protein n=1 Tax=Maribacter sp. ACAM166 TaxID=2508996 RepID=UPI0010FDBFF0|nr:hypothetical protein [Maribacter sp. ACAM166]TLP74164.1 hypothetical protein ES765_16660 [Maribacter sp. ACAM166]